ncbi:MAG: ADP-ribosylation factor-like protein, partial [Candidatus Hodarchaeota archaeon]
ALKRLSRGILVNPKPTQGFETETFSFLGVRFNVYDLGGQEPFHIFWEKFLPEQEAVVFFIDAADREDLDRVREILNKTLSLMNPESTFMILANKQDLPNALTVTEIIEILDLDLASKVKKLQIFDVSAKTGTGLYDAFHWLATALEMDAEEPKCTLFGFYIYERSVGIPLITGESAMKENPLILEDPTLITSLHSAIGSFATEMADSRLRSISIKSPKTGQPIQLTSVGTGNLVCVLITPDGTNEIVIGVIGEAILAIVNDRIYWGLEPGQIQLPEVLEVIRPFLWNVDQLNESTLSPSESSPPETPPSGKVSVKPDVDVQTEPIHSEDEMFFFRMGVTERIKYLQETRTRLKDKK